MIKFNLPGKQGQVLIGLGISRMNVRKLIEGLPISVQLGELDPKLKDCELFLFFEPTDAELMKAMESYIGPETTVYGCLDPTTDEFKKSTRH